MLKFPFEARFDEIRDNPGPFVASIFSCLESEFMVMPKGPGFIEYPVFERGYEALKRASAGFTRLTVEQVLPVTIAEPIAVVVLRSMLGFTPPEWAYLTSQRTEVEVSQGFARNLDRKIRMSPRTPINTNGVTGERLRAMVTIAC